MSLTVKEGRVILCGQPTKRGEPCKRNATVNGEHCRIHPPCPFEADGQGCSLQPSWKQAGVDR